MHGARTLINQNISAIPSTIIGARNPKHHSATDTRKQKCAYTSKGTVGPFGKEESKEGANDLSRPGAHIQKLGSRDIIAEAIHNSRAYMKGQFSIIGWV